MRSSSTEGHIKNVSTSHSRANSIFHMCVTQYNTGGAYLFTSGSFEMKWAEILFVIGWCWRPPWNLVFSFSDCMRPLRVINVRSQQSIVLQRRLFINQLRKRKKEYWAASRTISANKNPLEREREKRSSCIIYLPTVSFLFPLHIVRPFLSLLPNFPLPRPLLPRKCMVSFRCVSGTIYDPSVCDADRKALTNFPPGASWNEEIYA